MKLFLRQVWTLTVKNLLVVLVRPLFTTVMRALVLPVIFVAFMCVVQFAKSVRNIVSNANLALMLGTYSLSLQLMESAIQLLCDHFQMH